LVQRKIHPLGVFHQIPEKGYLATSDLSEGDVFLLLAQLHQGLHLPLLFIIVQSCHILARILLVQRELVYLDELLRLPDAPQPGFQLLVIVTEDELLDHLRQLLLVIADHIENMPFLQVRQIKVMLLIIIEYILLLLELDVSLLLINSLRENSRPMSIVAWRDVPHVFCERTF